MVPLHVTVDGRTVFCSTAEDDGRRWGVANPAGAVYGEPSRQAAVHAAASTGMPLAVGYEGIPGWFLADETAE